MSLANTNGGNLWTRPSSNLSKTMKSLRWRITLETNKLSSLTWSPSSGSAEPTLIVWNRSRWLPTATSIKQPTALRHWEIPKSQGQARQRANRLLSWMIKTKKFASEKELTLFQLTFLSRSSCYTKASSVCPKMSTLMRKSVSSNVSTPVRFSILESDLSVQTSYEWFWLKTRSSTSSLRSSLSLSDSAIVTSYFWSIRARVCTLTKTKSPLFSVGSWKKKKVLSQVKTASV